MIQKKLASKIKENKLNYTTKVKEKKQVICCITPTCSQIKEQEKGNFLQ